MLNEQMARVMSQVLQSVEIELALQKEDLANRESAMKSYILSVTNKLDLMKESFFFTWNTFSNDISHALRVSQLTLSYFFS